MNTLKFPLRTHRGRYWRLFMGCLAILLGPAAALVAHEVPQQVGVIAFVKPEGRTLRVLLRVPLEAMRDMEFAIRQNGSLDIVRARTLLPDASAIWITNYLHFQENGTPTGEGRTVATQLSLPSDRSFTSWNEAYAHIHAAGVPPETELHWQRALIDIELAYPIQDEHARFAMQSGLSHLGVKTITVLHFLAPGAEDRAFQFEGNPGVVQLDPTWYQASWHFVKLGFEHILGGYDHLLFVLCLVIPIRRWRSLAAIVTAFTAAHSVTLVASAYGFVPSGNWFPPLVETLIALSIVYMAIENMISSPEQLRNRWMLAFGFGLIHGFGFSFALREALQFAGTHLVAALAAFNLGVEAGQLFVLALALPVLGVVVRRSRNERAVVVVASALVAHSGWHWMTERFAAFSAYEFTAPVMDGMLLLGVLRGLLLL
ncbi:MAG: HupE/UreJ family protein, partial [Gemmatimonas sp.]